MNYVVQFSGGVGSFAAAQLVTKIAPLDQITLLFCDTKEEDESTYAFLHQSAAFLGLEVTVIADGRRIWELFRDRRVIGNSQMDTCSETLKRNLARSYIKKNFQPEETVLIFGIDWMEKHRSVGIVKRWDPYTCWFPLFDDQKYDKNKFMKQCVEEFGLTLPRLYGMNFAHSNCSGFCIKAGKAHFLNLLKQLPEIYAYHEEQEQIMQAFLEKPYTILRETKTFKHVLDAADFRDLHDGSSLYWWNSRTSKFIKVDSDDPSTFVPVETPKKFKVIRYISMKELRERAEEIAQTEEGQDEWGACGCFA
jgi:hypothetical protein